MVSLAQALASEASCFFPEGVSLIELGLAVVIGAAAPFGANPAAALETVQRGIERALGNLEGGPG